MNVVPASPSATRRSYSSRSFSRLESSASSPLTRGRASTLQDGPRSDGYGVSKFTLSPEEEEGTTSPEATFSKDEKENTEHVSNGSKAATLVPTSSVEDDAELPIELLSLSDR